MHNGNPKKVTDETYCTINQHSKDWCLEHIKTTIKRQQKKKRKKKNGQFRQKKMQEPINI